MFKRIKSLKSITLIIAFLLIVILSLQAPWQYFFEGQPLNLQVSAKADHDDVIQLFYVTDKNVEFSQENSLKVDISKSDSFQTLKFALPVKDIKVVRLATGNQPGELAIMDIKLKNFKTQHIWDAEDIKDEFQSSKNISAATIKENVLYLNVAGNDSWIVSGDIRGIFESVKTDNSIYFYLITSILMILLSVFYIFMTFYKRIFAFLNDIIRSRRLIFELAKKDLKNRYLGSYLGIIWAFVQPMVTILIFWFVFQVGFRSAPVDDFPYVLWLICGMIPWFFFSEGLQSATNSVLDNSYLVKKIVFRVNSLPIIRILSSLFIHVFFIIVIFVMFFIYGYKPSIYNLQVIYYLFATIVLVLGLSWITSSLVVFLRDLGQIVSIVIQFGFWLTPIFWSFKIMPEKYHFWFKLNPIYYIVEGYRDTFINHIWFWQHYNLTINFWVITLCLFFTGVLLFKRLRPHFADVL